MDGVDGTKYLKFYLDATIIRDMIKDDDYNQAYELMTLFVKTYLGIVVIILILILILISILISKLLLILILILILILKLILILI